MRILYICFFSIFVSLSSFAQQSSLTIGLGKPLQKNGNIGISGSPYLKDEFQSADVITTGGKILKALQIRYNILNQHIECSLTGGEYDVTDSVSQFNYTSSDITVNKFIKLKKDDGLQFSFFEILSPGKYELLKERRVEIVTDEDWYSKKVTKKYFVKTDYYLFTENKLSKLGSSKRAVLNAFAKNELVKKYLDGNDVDFSSDASMIKMFHSIN